MNTIPSVPLPVTRVAAMLRVPTTVLYRRIRRGRLRALRIGGRLHIPRERAT